MEQSSTSIYVCFSKTPQICSSNSQTCPSCRRESSCSALCRWSLLPWVTMCSRNGAKESAGAWLSPPWPSSPGTWATCSSTSKAHTKRWEQFSTFLMRVFHTGAFVFAHNVARSHTCRRCLDSDWVRIVQTQWRKHAPTNPKNVSHFCCVLCFWILICTWQQGRPDVESLEWITRYASFLAQTHYYTLWNRQIQRVFGAWWSFFI